MTLKLPALLLCLLLPGLALAGAPSPAAQAEITHLFDYLEHSGCQFNRNGSWYGAADAVAHLHKKYDYLQKKGLVGTAEDFITRAATESSTSGRPYQVKCGGAAAVASGPWFRAELERFRKTRP